MNSAEHVMDFLAWLTTRKEVSNFGSNINAAPAVQIFEEYAKFKKLPEISENYGKEDYNEFAEARDIMREHFLAEQGTGGITSAYVSNIAMYLFDRISLSNETANELGVGLMQLIFGDEITITKTGNQGPMEEAIDA